MELKLEARRCNGCTQVFRVLSKSVQVWCSGDCLIVNTVVKKARPEGKRTNTIMVEHRGQSQSLADWSRQLGVNYRLLYSRYRRTGKLS